MNKLYEGFWKHLAPSGLPIVSHIRQFDVNNSTQQACTRYHNDVLFPLFDELARLAHVRMVTVISFTQIQPGCTK